MATSQVIPAPAAPVTTPDAATPAAAPPAGGGQSFVQSLLNPTVGSVMNPTPATPAPEPRPVTLEQPTAGQQPAVAEPAQPVAGIPPVAEKPIASAELFAKVCAEHPGLDQSNPDHQRVLKRIADSQAYIEHLRSAAGTILATRPGDVVATPAVPSVTLADLEQQIEQEFKPPEPAQPVAAASPVTTPAAPQPQQGPMRFDDIGDEWKGATDAYKAVNDAWAEGDLAKVNACEAALFRRRVAFDLMPQLNSIIEERVNNRLKSFAEKDLGDVLPDMRQSASRQKEDAARTSAISQLRGAPEFKDIDVLMKDTGGPPLRIDGQEWPNTPLNQILAENPGLRRMKLDDPNPEKARRLTYLNRYALAARLYKQQQSAQVVDPAKAQALLDAGAALQAKEAADRTRQAMNAGPGATGIGAGTGEKSLVQEINSSVGANSFASLFK